MEALLKDLRYALRQLVTSPGFTTIAVLTLALGIGANAAIFSVVNAVLLRPLPYPRSEELVTLHSTGLFGERGSFALSYPDYERISHLQGSLAGSALYRTAEYNLTGTPDPREIEAAMVTASLFDVLGVRPILGRPFAASEEQEPVAVLSHRFWQSALGGDSSVVGRLVALDGVSYQV